MAAPSTIDDVIANQKERANKNENRNEFVYARTDKLLLLPVNSNYISSEQNPKRFHLQINFTIHRLHFRILKWKIFLAAAAAASN